MKIITDINFLRQKSTNVDSVEEAENIIGKIKGELINIDHGVGLAAIQIGIPKKVGVIKNGKDKDGNFTFQYLINAELIDTDDEIVFYKEGCLSLPGYANNTKRFRQITIRNDVIEDGEFREEQRVFYYPMKDEYDYMNSDPLTCIAVQHELDHFDGKLITDVMVKSEPITSSGKIGRNEPCVCGSGKKYKKCCGK